MLIYVIIVTFSLVGYVMFRRQTRNYSLVNEHFLITGGSSGIGLAIGIEAAKKGANVTLIARSKENLEVAKEAVSSIQNPSQKVLIFTADVYEEHENLTTIVEKAEQEAGPVTFLINCAGTSVSYCFEETPLEEFSKMMNTNYLGSVYMTRAVLGRMKERRCGRVVFVSSLAGLFGLYGYTAYSASKFALVGLAEALQMEVRPFNMSVTVSFPPDTDTPGYAKEIKTKPLPTQLICDSGGLYSARDVGIKIINDAISNRFMSSIGFEGWMLCTLCSGMAPVHSLLQLLIQVTVMGIFRVAGFIYLLGCNRTIKQCLRTNNQTS